MGWEVCGYIASGLVLATFSMRDMIPLRLMALASNVAFIAYGLALELTPIWLLHALLVPLNGYRLVEAVRLRVRGTLHPPHRAAGNDEGCEAAAVGSRRGPRLSQRSLAAGPLDTAALPRAAWP